MVRLVLPNSVLAWVHILIRQFIAVLFLIFICILILVFMLLPSLETFYCSAILLL